MGIIIAVMIWYLITYRDAVGFKGMLDYLFELVVIGFASVIFPSCIECDRIKDIVNM